MRHWWQLATRSWRAKPGRAVASTAAIAVVAADSAEEWATVMALAAGACLILTLATVVTRRRLGDLSAT